MNSYILKSLREDREDLYRPAIRRPGKKKSCFIDHNDYVVKDSAASPSAVAAQPCGGQKGND